MWFLVNQLVENEFHKVYEFSSVAGRYSWRHNLSPKTFAAHHQISPGELQTDSEVRWFSQCYLAINLRWYTSQSVVNREYRGTWTQIESQSLFWCNISVTLICCCCLSFRLCCRNCPRNSTSIRPVKMVRNNLWFVREM